MCQCSHTRHVPILFVRSSSAIKELTRLQRTLPQVSILCIYYICVWFCWLNNRTHNPSSPVHSIIVLVHSKLYLLLFGATILKALSLMKTILYTSTHSSRSSVHCWGTLCQFSLWQHLLIFISFVFIVTFAGECLLKSSKMGFSRFVHLRPWLELFTFFLWFNRRS